MTLNVNKLCFTYSSLPALDNITFEAHAGECLAILGTNGAGKSTLLKCIDGIVRCQEGEISADSVRLGKLRNSERAKIVGYVPQQLSFSDSTVFDAVLMGRAPYIRWEATKSDLSVVGTVIERMGLGALAARNVNELSGGERQRVAIARTLAQQPDILLFDEPTSNLDIKNQIEVLTTIRELTCEKKLTVIVAMHDLNLALRFADRFMLMKDNTVFAAGDSSVLTSESIFDVYGINAEIACVFGKTVVIPD